MNITSEQWDGLIRDLSEVSQSLSEVPNRVVSKLDTVFNNSQIKYTKCKNCGNPFVPLNENDTICDDCMI